MIQWATALFSVEEVLISSSFPSTRGCKALMYKSTHHDFRIVDKLFKFTSCLLGYIPGINALRDSMKTESSDYLRQWQKRKIRTAHSIRWWYYTADEQSRTGRGSLWCDEGKPCFSPVFNQRKIQDENAVFIARLCLNIQKLCNRLNSGRFHTPLFEKMIA